MVSYGSEKHGSPVLCLLLCALFCISSPSEPFLKPRMWICNSLPQPVCYPCEVSQGGSVIASPPAGCLVFVQHNKYMCLKSALIMVMMLQDVFYNIAGNTGCRWLRAACPHGHHGRVCMGCPQHLQEHVGQGTWLAPPSPGDQEPLARADTKAARLVFSQLGSQTSSVLL